MRAVVAPIRDDRANVSPAAAAARLTRRRRVTEGYGALAAVVAPGAARRVGVQRWCNCRGGVGWLTDRGRSLDLKRHTANAAHSSLSSAPSHPIHHSTAPRVSPSLTPVALVARCPCRSTTSSALTARFRITCTPDQITRSARRRAGGSRRVRATPGGPGVGQARQLSRGLPRPPVDVDRRSPFS
jgi:hypothetical protein